MQTSLALLVQFCLARFLSFASLFPLCLLSLSPFFLLLLLLKNIQGALVLVEVVQAEGIIDRVILLGEKTTSAKFRSKDKIVWRARAR
jgi:hypothetical protein